MPLKANLGIPYSQNDKIYKYNEILYTETNNFLSYWKADSPKNVLYNDKALQIERHYESHSVYTSPFKTSVT